MVVRVALMFLAVLTGGLVAGIIVKSMPDRSERDEQVVAAVETAPQPSGWTTEIRAERNGHFYIDAVVKTARIRFMIDTGATRTSLSVEDARLLNIHLRDEDFVGYVQTANGIARVAIVTIPTIRIDDNWIYNHEVAVAENMHGTSVLGMNFLSELERYEITDQVLTLYW